MSCGGNTIARALALVTIATGVAFVDWARRPFVMELAPPSRDEAPAPSGGDTTSPDTGNAAASGTQPTGESETATKGNTDATLAPFDPYALGTEIGTPDAYELWASGEVVFIDARPQHEYVEGHIPFAYCIPPDTLNQGRLGDMMEMGGVFPSTRVVVYCEGGNCDASHLVALTLQDMGFNKLHIDVDGYPGWVDAGHEIETGPDQILGELP